MLERLTMNFPALLILILATCHVAIAAESHKGTDVNMDPDGVTIINPFDATNGDPLKDYTHTGTSQNTFSRQKRALSAFLQAWKQLLKTTLGFYTGYRNTGRLFIQQRRYVKVGKLDDAKRDFDSLGLSKIEKRPYGISGIAQNKLVILYSSPPKIGVWDISSSKFAPRAIEYHETFAEANAVLNPEQRYTLH